MNRRADGTPFVVKTMSDPPPDATWETPCPARTDRRHCTHWYDGGPCCGCDDPADPAAPR